MKHNENWRQTQLIYNQGWTCMSAGCLNPFFLCGVNCCHYTDCGIMRPGVVDRKIRPKSSDTMIASYRYKSDLKK